MATVFPSNTRTEFSFIVDKSIYVSTKYFNILIYTSIFKDLNRAR